MQCRYGARVCPSSGFLAFMSSILNETPSHTNKPAITSHDCLYPTVEQGFFNQSCYCHSQVSQSIASTALISACGFNPAM